MISCNYCGRAYRREDVASPNTDPTCTECCIKKQKSKSNMTAAQWHVLDNILHGWNYRLYLTRDEAQKALTECVEKGWIKNGQITLEGKFELQFGEGRSVGRFPISGD